MSTSTALGFVGGAIGFWIGGPAGAQVGFMLGSAVGGYIDPEQVFGPRLQDASQQTSRVGIPIPFGWGTFPVAGNLLWAGPITEHENEERQGKGGGPEQVTYTYTRSYAIGLCQGMLREDGLYDPIAGIVMVKRNGKVVYDARSDDELEEEFTLSGPVNSAFDVLVQYIAHQRALSASFLNKATFYLGSETQLPDATMEMHIGAGQVPAYPGLVYMVVDEDDVTETAGAIPQYEVVVATGGTSTEVCDTDGLMAWWPLDDAVPDGSASELVAARNGVYTSNVSTGPILSLDGGGSMLPGDSEQYMLVENAEGLDVSTLDGWTLTAWFRLDDEADPGTQRIIAIGYSDEFTGRYAWGLHLAGTNNLHLSGGFNHHATGTEYIAQDPDEIVAGQTVYAAIVADHVANTLTLYKNGRPVHQIVPAVTSNGSPPDIVQINGPGGHHFEGPIGNVKLYNHALSETEVRARWLSADNALLSAIPGLNGYYVMADGTVIAGGCSDVVARESVVLGTIVAGLHRRVGIPAASYDVSQLTDLVEGARFANVSGPDAMIEPLAQAYKFDKDERDGKLYWVKRGGEPVASIGPDDLVEREGDAIEWTRVQEAELLRKTSVTYLDPAANWAPVTQTAERRTSTVQAKGEAVFEVPICAVSDEAARMADKTLKASWGEPEKCKFSLSLAWAELSTTDPVWLTDKDGEVHHVRIMSIEEDSGVLLVEGTKTRQSIYTSNVSGVRPTPPRVTTPGLIGPTLLAVMDLPVLRDADDKLGVYVAVRGVLSGWSGSRLYLSTDGGISGGTVADITRAATIGYTETALVADVSSEYPSGQTLQVWLPDAPSSVDYATLLRYNNRAALQLDSGEWEVLQYQTVTDDGDGRYTLSGLVRGRYATTPGAAAAGNTFVLLDTAVQFIECERWMVGDSDLMVKAVSFGNDPDATAYVDFDFTTPASQTEWPPTNVTATRDGSDNVTAIWAGRPRLGTETDPHHSQFFTGYRVSYSDGVDTFTYDVAPSTLITSSGAVLTLETSGHTYTAAMQASDFGSVPASLTVTVAALNAITGAGPSSEEATA